MRNFLSLLIVLVVCAGTCSLSAQEAPTGLLCNLLSNPEKSVITDPQPDFGWVMNSKRNDEIQTAFQILVSSSLDKLNQEKADLWDSGKMVSAQSINVPYAGSTLQASTSYWWKVRTWDKEGEPSAYSQPQQIHIGDIGRKKAWPGESRWIEIPDVQEKNGLTFEDRSPLSYHPISPTLQTINPDGSIFIDFGRAAFSALDLTLTWQPQDPATPSCTIQIDLGELNRGKTVNRKPGGGIIYTRIPLILKPGSNHYAVPIPRFVPRYPESLSLPSQMREVIPFRYVQIQPGLEKVTVEEARQLRLHIEFDDHASFFTSSNPVLNQVYDLCKYSIKVNTFNGDYAGSERERMLYEADTYIQQTSHYAIDREYAIARYSAAYMIYHATWPTEWIPHSVFMAYADYLYTGNTKFISLYYSELKPKTLLALAGDDGLISSQTGLQTKSFLESIHYPHGQLRDIVDWPTGETDGYVFCKFNTVVNAFHYRALVLMEKIAQGLNKTGDAALYHELSEKVRASFNAKFFDPGQGLYVDGIGTTHASLHANLFALAFGLVPTDRQGKVVRFIKSRGMACSVYPTVYLLDSLYDAGEEQYAMDLLTSTTDRSWYNMIRAGSTVTTESWDVKYKKNEGWTHAWSTAPVQIIPRKIMGIEPLEPGFGKILIQPRPGNLVSAQITVPTIRGPIAASFNRDSISGTFHFSVTLPANMTARVVLPRGKSSDATVFWDGHPAQGKIKGDHVSLDPVGSGQHTFSR